MEFNLKKINFRQPKYIFPLVLAVPFGALLYLCADLFSDLGSKEEAPTDFINTELPEPKLKEEQNKMKMMENRYQIDEAYGAVEGFGGESDGKENIDGTSEYSDEELEQILRESNLNNEQQQQVMEAESRLRQMQESMKKTDSDIAETTRQQLEYNPYKELDDMQHRRNEELRAILSEPSYEEKQRAERERIAREKAEQEARENPTYDVIKEKNLSHMMFNTVSNTENSDLDTPLIKAMIDQTTKSTDGTRLRFKLMDDVVISDYRLKKGTYLYGTVSGFGTQRVKANISTILVGDKFLKCSLDVYDLDGMEGFYVPESSFREFMKNAAAGIAGQSIQFNSGGSMGGGIDGENLALQAIQNVYQSMSSAISGNLRKNKAKIKYNTIVYLINSKNN